LNHSPFLHPSADCTWLGSRVIDEAIPKSCGLEAATRLPAFGLFLITSLARPVPHGYNGILVLEGDVLEIKGRMAVILG
jgi:hypothetical protein